MGKDYMDILFLSVFLGIFIQKSIIPKTSNTIIITIFLINSYFALWVSSSNFGLPAPISPASRQLMEWKNFAQMVLIYFLTIALVKTEKQQKYVFMLISFILFFVSLRNYRNFTGGPSFNWDRRVGGPFERVGLGANHYAAFISYCQSAVLGMSFFEDDKRIKLFYIITFCMCLHPLLYSYSRGAYVAATLVIIFYAFYKKPMLLVGLLVVAIGWKTILPMSVIDRIDRTITESGELEGSAYSRLLLWEQSRGIINRNPVLGSGWESFGLAINPDDRIHELTDTHNYYIKVLCDRGVAGLLLLLFLLFKAFLSGYKLYRIGNSQFQKGLGFCFLGSILSLVTTNMFGDRFTYFVLGSYFWLLWGLVDVGILLVEQNSEAQLEGASQGGYTP